MMWNLTKKLYIIFGKNLPNIHVNVRLGFFFTNDTTHLKQMRRNQSQLQMNTVALQSLKKECQVFNLLQLRYAEVTCLK